MRVILITDQHDDAAHVRSALAAFDARFVEVVASDGLTLAGGDCALVLVHPERRGELLRRFGAAGHPVVALCPERDIHAIPSALRGGALDALVWPCSPEELEARIERAVHLNGQLEQLAAQNRALEQLSATDALTGIANRRHFENRLGEEFRRALRYDDPLSLVLLDIDHFKGINDRFGHVFGDTVLGAVAKAIQGAVRDTDLVARYGGEEFAILLPRTPLAGSLSVAERIRSAVRQSQPLHEADLVVTASLGVAAHPGVPLTQPVQLLHAADNALYRAKREGRDRICLHGAVVPGPSAAPRVVTHPG